MSNLRVRSETWRLVSIFTEPISSGERELSGHFWESDRSEKNQFNVLTLIVGDKKLNGSFRDNAKSLTPGVDPHYEPDLWTTLRTGPWTTPTDPLNGPPQNRGKIVKKYFTYKLSNRLLISVIFRVLHCPNVTEISFLLPPPKRRRIIRKKEEMLQSCSVQPKRCWWKKGMVLLSFAGSIWLWNDVFLGRLSLFVSVIPQF